VLGKEIAEKHKEYQAVKSAENTLAEKPDDPAANLAMGKYLCFSKGEWEWGIDWRYFVGHI
jgi:hypothetical protein